MSKLRVCFALFSSELGLSGLKLFFYMICYKIPCWIYLDGKKVVELVKWSECNVHHFGISVNILLRKFTVNPLTNDLKIGVSMEVVLFQYGFTYVSTLNEVWL